MFFWRNTILQLVFAKFLALLRRRLNPLKSSTTSTALVPSSLAKKQLELQQLGTIIALYRCSGPSLISAACTNEINLGILCSWLARQGSTTDGVIL
jgi:hypothetical protein